MEKESLKRVISRKEIGKVHSYGYRTLFFNLFLIFISLLGLIVIILAGINYIISGEGNWILMLIAFLFFVAIFIFFIWNAFKKIKYIKAGSGERVYMVEDELRYAELYRTGTYCYLGNQQVELLPELHKIIKKIKYGTLVEADIVKIGNSYLVLSVVKIEKLK